MLYVTIASTSPMAPLIWLRIVVGVVGAAVWQDASEMPEVPSWPSLSPEPEKSATVNVPHSLQVPTSARNLAFLASTDEGESAGAIYPTLIPAAV